MKEIKFNVVLTNELEVDLMGEPKIFTLYVMPKDAAPYKVQNLFEHEVMEQISKLISFR